MFPVTNDLQPLTANNYCKQVYCWFCPINNSTEHEIVILIYYSISNLTIVPWLFFQEEYQCYPNQKKILKITLVKLYYKSFYWKMAIAYIIRFEYKTLLTKIRHENDLRLFSTVDKH